MDCRESPTTLGASQLNRRAATPDLRPRVPVIVFRKTLLNALLAEIDTNNDQVQNYLAFTLTYSNAVRANNFVNERKFAASDTSMSTVISAPAATVERTDDRTQALDAVRRGKTVLSPETCQHKLACTGGCDAQASHPILPGFPHPEHPHRTEGDRSFTGRAGS